MQRLLDLEIGEVMLIEVVYLLNLLDVLKLFFSKDNESLTKLCSDFPVILVDLLVSNKLQLFHDVVP